MIVFLTFLLIIWFVCLLNLVILLNVHDYLWCCKLYCKLYDKQSYNVYKYIKDNIGADNIVFCTLDEHAKAWLCYSDEEFSKLVNSKLIWNDNTYYIITDEHYSIMKNNKWVLVNFFTPLTNDISKYNK